MGNQDLHNVCSAYDIEVNIYQASELSGSSVVWLSFFCSIVTLGIDI